MRNLGPLDLIEWMLLLSTQHPPIDKEEDKVQHLKKFLTAGNQLHLALPLKAHFPAVLQDKTA